MTVFAVIEAHDGHTPEAVASYLGKGVAHRTWVREIVVRDDTESAMALLQSMSVVHRCLEDIGERVLARKVFAALNPVLGAMLRREESDA